MQRQYNGRTNIFRAYDIRGVYGIDLDESIAFEIGKAYGIHFLLKQSFMVFYGHQVGHSILGGVNIVIANLPQHVNIGMYLRSLFLVLFLCFLYGRARF